MNMFSVFSSRCHSHNVLEGISDKWSILLITCLSGKTLRFGELKRHLDGISAKVLTQTLQKLEKYGFILRNDFGSMPMKVEYSLSDLGQELNAILTRLTQWTEANMEKIMASEQDFLR